MEEFGFSEAVEMHVSLDMEKELQPLFGQEMKMGRREEIGGNMVFLQFVISKEKQDTLNNFMDKKFGRDAIKFKIRN